jgi:ferric-dicitrate binding protein FerR (iron transport regulator)
MRNRVFGGIMIDADERLSFEDEDATARLLRTAGPRPEVPAERGARVRSAVYLQWQASTHRRAVRRGMLAVTALLAAAAGLVLVATLTRPREDAVAPVVEAVATVERVEGEARLAPQAIVRTGEWVETGATARLALRLSDGTSVRLDIGSRTRLLSSTRIELAYGALYLDTGGYSKGLEVRTPMGTVHDIGTQFEIRVRDSSLRLRVRTGVVEVRRGAQSIPARSGTELTLGAEGAVSRRLTAHGPEWEWAVNLVPPFEIEGRPLAAFLEHLSREHGWTLRYADGNLARDSSSIILHGSVHGLQPRDALGVALTTSGLFHRFRDGELLVSRTPIPH